MTSSLEPKDLRALSDMLGATTLPPQQRVEQSELENRIHPAGGRFAMSVLASQLASTVEELEAVKLRTARDVTDYENSTNEYKTLAASYASKLGAEQLRVRELEKQLASPTPWSQLHARLWDLVRYVRGELHREGLITDEELAALVQIGSDSARRLENYDALRARVRRLEREVKSRNSLIELPDVQCTWAPDYEGTWWTGCGSTFEPTSGSPLDNGMRFCPYCGRKMEEVGYRGE